MLTLRYRALVALSVISALGATLVVTAPAQAAPPKCFGRTATITGTNKGNRINGTNGTDVIVARGGNDVVRGRGGNDFICGSGGRDTLFGDAGQDLIDLGGGNLDTGLGGDGNDLIRGKITEFDIASFVGSPLPITGDLSEGTASGQGADNLVGISGLQGSDQDDTLIGDDGENILAGEGGADTLDGEGAADALYGYSNPIREHDSDRADVITGDGGNDLVVGGTGNDNLNGGDDVDLVEGGTGDDSMIGGGQFLDTADYSAATGPVTVNFSSGNATGMGTDTLTGFTDIWGSPFADTLTGSDQPDEGFAGRGGDDIIHGRGGENDAVDHSDDESAVIVDLAAGTATGAFAGSDQLQEIETALGSNGNDSLSGNAVPNFLYGLDGSDTLAGHLANDHLDGGNGNDSLNGGDGADTCLAGESLISCESTTPPARIKPDRVGARFMRS